MQHEGRWCPLDTLARDLVQQVTGTDRWEDLDPVLVLLDWTFRPEEAAHQPLIRVRNAEVRRLINLPADQDRFSLAFLQEHEGLNRCLAEAMRKRRSGAALDALDGKVEDIASALATLRGILSDDEIRPVPDPTSPKGRWMTIARATGQDKEQLDKVREFWKGVRSAFLSGRGVDVESAATRLADALSGLKAAHRPSARRIALELRYNSLDPFRWSWILAAVTAGVAILAIMVGRRVLDVVVWVGAAAAFALVTYGLVARWQLAERFPAANMYESLIFMGWGLCLATLICLVVVRNRLVTLVASLMTAISLMLADVLPVDSFLRPVAPVLLDTAWMAIHVPVIMVSYSVLTIAMGFGLAVLVMSALAPRRDDLIKATDHLHYRFIQIGVILLTIGIITGSMWGSASWGRYWGWDPKEVWSLVAMLGYVAILHARATGWIRAFGTALFSTLAFWLIVMTYLGVNYVLGIGLHSYGFGKGAIVRWFMIIGSIQLAVTAATVGTYLARRTSSGLGQGEPRKAGSSS
ncbi:MAG: cytochrome c biogenesis protein CcsA [Phycisphaerae bacterium]|nr:cytochrome c biogenesis protein CcsA [Phycisphaerae bacterium]